MHILKYIYYVVCVNKPRGDFFFFFGRWLVVFFQNCVLRVVVFFMKPPAIKGGKKMSKKAQIKNQKISNEGKKK